MPTLQMVERLVGDRSGGRHARVRVGALRDLAMRSITGTALVDLQQGLSWLEPRAVTRVIKQLCGAGLLEQQPDQSFRLPRDARVVGALCAALMVPQVDYSRIVRALGHLIAFTRDLGGEETHALVPFRMAVAVCEEDIQEMSRLLHEGSAVALGEAAELGRQHAKHMQELLDEQERSHPVLGADPAWLQLSDRANEVVPRLFQLSTHVLEALAEVAEERLRGGARLERDDVRRYVQATPLAELAAGLGANLTDPPRLPAFHLPAGLAHLDMVLRATRRRRPPVPEPAQLTTTPLPATSADPVAELAIALERLAAAGGGPLAELVVGEGWERAANRFAQLLEAWARYGPSGHASLAATIRFAAGLTPLEPPFEHAGVQAMTPSRVEPPEVPA